MKTAKVVAELIREAIRAYSPETPFTVDTDPRNQITVDIVGESTVLYYYEATYPYPEEVVIPQCSAFLACALEESGVKFHFRHTTAVWTL